MPHVSILIPCYNAERWVAQAIQSALDQTHPDKEVIVVDDGSTDGSLDVIKSFGDEIRWETGSNRGGNVARNRLLEVSTGEWLQYLDADDYLKPTKIENQLRAWQNSGGTADVIYSPVCVETWTDGAVADTTVLSVNAQESVEEHWIRWRVAQTGTVLWKRSSLSGIGGWNVDFHCCQDNEVTLRAIQNGLGLRYFPKAEAVYRIWSTNTVCRKDISRLIAVKTRLLDQMLCWLKEQERLQPEAVVMAGQAFFEMARALAATNLSEASAYHRERQNAGYFVPRGPAAPRLYRFMYQLTGFRATELLARWLRN